ncbi:MAG: dTDP-4-dehydrorhamnose 3,5-epimerase [Candidatus Hodarchaeota archaeon]
MYKFKKSETSIDGLFVIEPLVYGDNRGFFMETYNKQAFRNLGIFISFVQDNHSKSTKGVLRGLHFQTRRPQEKMVRIIKGAVYDVAVDLRRESSTYGQYFGIKLSEENKKMVYIPKEFAHGFLALTEEVEIIYKVTDYYFPEYELGIIWNDPTINIHWPFEKYKLNRPILSEKDKNLPTFLEIENQIAF